jgi:hypothetical protein
MTAVTAPRAVATPFGRILNVVRLNTTNPWTILLLPWIIMLVILTLNIIIWSLLAYSLSPEAYAQAQIGFQWSGASLWIFVYMLIAGVQVMSITFPFALGYGVTRRDFYLGSSLTFVLAGIMYAAGMTILATIETVTDGWWLGGRMFTSVYFGGADALWYERFWIFLCYLLLAFFVGAAFAAVWVRWKAYGITITFIGLAFLLVGLVAIGVFANLGADFWAVVIQLSNVQAASWSLVLTAISALTGYLLLRWATPRAA